MVMVLFTIELLLLSVIVRSLAKGFRAYYRILVCVCLCAFVCMCLRVHVFVLVFLRVLPT